MITALSEKKNPARQRKIKITSLSEPCLTKNWKSKLCNPLKIHRSNLLPLVIRLSISPLATLIWYQVDSGSSNFTRYIGRGKNRCQNNSSYLHLKSSFYDLLQLYWFFSIRVTSSANSTFGAITTSCRAVGSPKKNYL